MAAADRALEEEWQKMQFQHGAQMAGSVDKLDRFNPNCVNPGSNPGCRIVVCDSLGGHQVKMHLKHLAQSLTHPRH